MSTRSVEALERALRDLGIRCSVEAFDALAAEHPWTQAEAAAWWSKMPDA